MNETDFSSNTSSIVLEQYSAPIGRMTTLSLLFVTSWIICIGNTLTLYIIIRSRNLHSTADLFLANLAVSDLMVGLVGFMKAAAVFNIFSNVLHRFKFMCLIYFGLMTLPISASCFNVVMVSLDRCLCICKPLFYRRHVNPKRTGVAIAMIWVISVVFTVTLFSDNQDREMVICVFFSVTAPWVSTIFMPIQFAFTAIIVISCYVLIFRTIVKHSKKRRSMHAAQGTHGTSTIEELKSCSGRTPGNHVPTDVAIKRRVEAKDTRNNMKLLQTILVVIVCYFACQLPGSIVAALGSFYREYIPLLVFSFVTYLAVINSGTNFFIYIIFNPRYRGELKLLFCNNNRPRLGARTPTRF